MFSNDISDYTTNRLTQDYNYGIIDEDLIRDECLHNLFEEVVDNYPGNIAIEFKGKKVTYFVLEIMANKLADYLTRQGVKPGDCIGILLNKSIDMYVSILAVLKAGGTYIPMDPSHPKERIMYIIEDCNAKILITTSAIVKSIRASTRSILLDKEAANIQKRSPLRKENSEVGVTRDQIAYIIYTSGSTGNPKGVQIQHKSVAHVVRASQTFYKVEPSDKVYQGFTTAFDAAVEEVWMAFSNGATLLPATKEMQNAGLDLPFILIKLGVTVLSCTPTLLSMMENDIPTLRLLIVGGEDCPQHIVNRWAKRGRHMFNTYGPTETTVIVTYKECLPGEKVTIGRPLPNTSAYIMDSNMNVLPHGQKGELCIGGIGLSPGYINRDDLTDEKFIKNPFADDYLNSEKLYRTGDLAMFNSQGDIEFCGRIDNQVKIRGYRIELSEIESVLSEIPNIQASVATVMELTAGVQSIVAYIVPDKETSKIDFKLVRKTINQRLPSYMVPKCYEVIAELPTLPSGKVDRKKLPKPKVSEENNNSTKKFIKPRNSTETTIAEVFEKVFNLSSISVNDNFFEDLGGHSLVVAKAVSLLRKENDMKGVSTSDIYNYPTVEELANRVKELQGVYVDKANYTVNKKAYRPSFLKHSTCGIFQAASIYLVYLVTSIPLIYIMLFSTTDWGLEVWTRDKLITVVAPIILVNILYVPVTLLASIIVKWLVIGHFKPGKYKVWGLYYFRWWIVMIFQTLTPTYLLNGTPLLAIYLRLMGAVIGKNCYIGTNDIRIFDLIKIGRNTSIGVDAQLLGYTVEHGYLIIGKIEVGSNCYVGAGSILSINTRMRNDSQLAEQSMLSINGEIPKGKRYSGSPAVLDNFIDTDIAEMAKSPVYVSMIKKLVFAGIYSMLITLLGFVPFLAQIPSVALLVITDIKFGSFFYLCIPVAGLMFVICFCLEVILLKRLLVGKLRPKQYRIYSIGYIRKWILDSLMTMSLIELPSMYATVYTATFLRALGAKLGKNVEVSTVSNFVPDLVSVGNQSFLADASSIGTAKVYMNSIKLDKTKIGDRTFIGNSALVPINKVIGDNCLLGVLSIPKKENETKSGTSWLGSPPIFLPKRDINTSFSEAQTYKPTRTLLFKRYFIEFIRVILPAAVDFLVLCLVYRFFLEAKSSLSLSSLILLFPLFALALSLGLTLIVALAKRLLVGEYKTDAKPLWSTYTWRSELATSLYETIVVPEFLELLVGTPFISWILRIFGSKIGSRVFIDTTFFSEFDLVEIDDDSAINYNATMQTHLFEDRVMKMSYLRIGKSCSVGNSSVVLYDTKMNDGTILGSLSLLMKGESLPEWTRWDGIPVETTNIESDVERTL